MLAVNEALTNAAEFAYVGAEEPGTMAVTARYEVLEEPAGSRLVVTVTDHGTWLHKEPDGRPNTRGRGIELMNALSDRASIDRAPDGTRVVLEFDGCQLRSEEPFATTA